MKKHIPILILIVPLLNISVQNLFGQNDHFGRYDRRFLWGVSGGVSIPYSRPSNLFSSVDLRPGFDFGIDFRHRLGYENYNSYFVFLHYGVNMGSFYYRIINDNLGDASKDKRFLDEYNPRFLHLDIPIGVEFPLGYFCQNRLSFNAQTALTSRFYFFSPNQIYNLATTNTLAFRFDKIQIQATYSFFFFSQYSRQIVPQYADWKTSEIVVGLKFYF